MDIRTYRLHVDAYGHSSEGEAMGKVSASSTPPQLAEEYEVGQPSGLTVIYIIRLHMSSCLAGQI